MGAKAADSDIRMLIATQVAYLNGDEDMRVGELVDRIISNYGGRSNLSKQQQAQLDTAQYIQAKIKENNLYECNHWVIKSVSDDSSGSGFYGCLIDTNDGEAILGFRGSESYDMNQTVKDWGQADLGLLNNESTTQQQRSAEAYTRYINKRFGDQYENFSFTGHSLGGNLAEHATITAPEGMPVNRCLSLDGPGYSDEYIKTYQDAIAARGKYVDHYQYSWVGTLLNPLPGTKYQTIDAHNDAEHIWPFSYFWRHDTKNIDFDENGNARPGSRDSLSLAAGPFSRGIENGPPAWLWVVSPQLALLMTISQNGVEMLSEMAEQAQNLLTSIQTTIQSIRNAVGNWFRSMFGVALTGEFELNTGYVNAVGEGLNSTARQFRNISDEIYDISRRLRYNSITGSYYKSRLRSISSKVGRDATKAAALSDAVRSCVQYSLSSDSKAGQLFSGI